MSGVKYVQDVAPKNGFPAVLYRRDLPKRGISGWGSFVVGALVMIGGLYVALGFLFFFVTQA
jgi:hypothetical protein